MQFKHPELLYALFLLVIPIFIHLFQLRRFKKLEFSNLDFLKRVRIKTRKSSQLKKWILLLTRMAIFSCIILAFSQPFSASKSALKNDKELVIYIDNSFSTQLIDTKGVSLQTHLQKLYSQDFYNYKINWLTNDFSKRNTSVQNFKNDILTINHSQRQLSPKEVIIKSYQLFSTINNNSEKRIIYISDFQSKSEFPEVPDGITLDIIALKYQEVSNINIDSVFIANTNIASVNLKVIITGQGLIPETVPISLYNENKLIAKTAVNFGQDINSIKKKEVVFEINNNEKFDGKLEITDPNLKYDNNLYFSTNLRKKIKVLEIGNIDNNYFKRIFKENEFNFTQQGSKSLNYTNFSSQNFIILNELEQIPESLITAIKSYTDQGGSLLIIPSSSAIIEQYNLLYASLELGSILNFNKKEKKITKIEFENPLYKNVFEKEIINFQYPIVNSFFNLNSSVQKVLSFEDSKPFLLRKNQIYASTAAINLKNSNFQNSPLIVPTFYNMAKQSLALPKLYYEIGKQNLYSILISLKQDEILKISDSLNTFIPLQQTKKNQVNITTENNPSNAGNYSITKDDIVIDKVSYNFDRQESILTYSNPNNWDNTNLYNNVGDLFNNIALDNKINSFWKWFVILALLFLLIELVILKFYK
ncbi:BatA domain-containing protein [Flavobacteriaceae bacterium]|nr:BatA domain-containing protein [Flavobacteriaceae bacterium]